MDCFRDVRRLNVFGSFKISYGPRDLEDAMVRAGRESELFHSLFQKRHGSAVELTMLLYESRTHLRVGESPTALRRSSWTLRAALTCSRMLVEDSPSETPVKSRHCTEGTSTCMSIRSRSGPRSCSNSAVSLAWSRCRHALHLLGIRRGMDSWQPRA